MTWPIFNSDDVLSEEEAERLKERFLAAQGQPAEFMVVKQSAVLPVSDELLMDEGVIPDTRPPLKVGWRTRFRWWLSPSRERFGRWLGGKIAGVDLTDRDDW